MTPTDLIAIIEEQERLARAGGRLEDDRIEATAAYYGRPYGDEEEGSSSVVMRDVADTVEWVKPSLMKVFCSGDDVCTFNPIGPEDEPQAEQESDWCNHVLMQRNEGFLILHDWFHDALVLKNGYVLVSYEQEPAQKDRYEGKTDDEFALMLQELQQGAQLLEHSAREAIGPDGMPMALHDYVIQAAPKGCIKLTNIPPERVLVAADWPGVSLQGCPFVEVVDFKTISELRADGLEVSDTISDTGGEDDNERASNNRRYTEDRLEDHEELGADMATRRLRVRYVWMMIDADGDGKAELKRFTIVGQTILDEDEDGLIPVACAVPYRIPHEHNGMSVHDMVGDIQRIRTALIRGFLDNMYQVNSPRFGVDATMVNVDDMLTTRPGGIVRVAGAPGQAIQSITHPADGGAILSAVEYVDSVRENRTGVTKYNQGLDANSLNKTAHGVSQIMNASQQRIELVARILAETGMKQLMLIVHAMSLKHIRMPEMAKLRNKWVPVNPSTWRTRRDMTVSVGLGTGNKDQMLQHLQTILLAQKEGLALGLATPKNIYNALVKMTQNAGFKMPDEFWTDPGEGQQQQQQTNPLAEAEQVKAQAAMQQTQMKLQSDGQRAQMTAETDMQRQQMQLQFDAQQREADRQAQLLKTQLEIESRERIEMEKLMLQERTGQEAAMQQQAAAQQEQGRAQQATQKEAAVGEIAKSMQQIIEALNKPIKLKRGADGITEVH